VIGSEPDRQGLDKLTAHKQAMFTFLGECDFRFNPATD